MLAGTRDTRRPGADGRPVVVHEPVRLELRFSPRSGHFVGTRNGTAVWLARGVIRPGAGGCPP